MPLLINRKTVSSGTDSFFHFLTGCFFTGAQKMLVLQRIF